MELLLDATTPSHIEDIRNLFEEYAASLDFNLCFQNFSAELAKLPGDYAPPSGCLLLAVQGGTATGCVALRRLEGEIGEMKRLYVRPQFRGLGIGKALTEEVVRRAQKIGYKTIRLDTVNSMVGAQALYKKLGFTDTEPYYFNPLKDVRFMELNL
ncbi:MAG: GNAT family N-acetyltransferase [Candidatus Competibacter sp.]